MSKRLATKYGTGQILDLLAVGHVDSRCIMYFTVLRLSAMRSMSGGRT